MWQVEHTENFQRCIKDLGLSQEQVDFFDQWASSAQRQPLSHMSPICKQKDIFEVWQVRLPDKESNRGSSGAFRMVYFFQLKEATVFLDFVEYRDKLGFKKEHSKLKKKHEKYLKELEKDLISQLC